MPDPSFKRATTLADLMNENLRDIMRHIREIDREVFLLNHPFGADLAACAETNS